MFKVLVILYLPVRVWGLVYTLSWACRMFYFIHFKVLRQNRPEERSIIICIWHLVVNPHVDSGITILTCLL